MLSTYVSFKTIAGNLTRSLTLTAKEPVVKRESAYYLANIGKVKSVDDFLKDTRLFSFAMKAFGLGDMSYAKGFMRKLLDGGVDSHTSLANKLTDTRYKEFATAFNFAHDGAAATADPQTRQPVVDKYVRQTMEEEAGQQNDGVRLALYFQRKAPKVTSAYGILGDKALLTVVQTTLGISPLSSKADIDLQARQISAKLNVKDFQDPAKLQTFLQRFAATYDANTFSDGSAAPSNALLITEPLSGISADLITSLQGFRLGGV